MCTVMTPKKEGDSKYTVMCSREKQDGQPNQEADIQPPEITVKH